MPAGVYIGVVCQAGQTLNALMHHMTGKFMGRVSSETLGKLFDPSVCGAPVTEELVAGAVPAVKDEPVENSSYMNTSDLPTVFL